MKLTNVSEFINNTKDFLCPHFKLSTMGKSQAIFESSHTFIMATIFEMNLKINLKRNLQCSLETNDKSKLIWHKTSIRTKSLLKSQASDSMPNFIAPSL